MNTKKFIKKPIEMEAIQLLKTHKSVTEVYKFIHGEESVKLSCQMAEDYWDQYVDGIIKDGGLKLKTPESHGETQIASFTDYVFKGYSKELGWHFWPVKESYVLENYNEVI